MDSSDAVTGGAVVNLQISPLEEFTPNQNFASWFDCDFTSRESEIIDPTGTLVSRGFVDITKLSLRVTLAFPMPEIKNHLSETCLRYENSYSATGLSYHVAVAKETIANINGFTYTPVEIGVLRTIGDSAYFDLDLGAAVAVT